MNNVTNSETDPDHYSIGGSGELWDLIPDLFPDPRFQFYQALVLRYLRRFPFKYESAADKLRDIEKAETCLAKLKERFLIFAELDLLDEATAGEEFLE